MWGWASTNKYSFKGYKHEPPGQIIFVAGYDIEGSENWWVADIATQNANSDLL